LDYIPSTNLLCVKLSSMRFQLFANILSCHVIDRDVVTDKPTKLEKKNLSYSFLWQNTQDIPYLWNWTSLWHSQAPVPSRCRCAGQHCFRMQEGDFLMSKKRGRLVASQCTGYLSTYMGVAALLSIHRKWAKYRRQHSRKLNNKMIEIRWKSLLTSIIFRSISSSLSTFSKIASPKQVRFGISVSVSLGHR